MSLPFLTPSRCVLLIGDDALYVYNVKYNGTRLLDVVPWSADNFEVNVATLIQKEAGGKSVLILNDMTDQHFKGGQRLPKVGPLDKKNVLARKLQVAFPTYPIRGALPVKAPKRGSMPDEERKRQTGLYLFAAVPMSDPVSRTMDAVRKSLSPVTGFFLLPIEAADMVGALAKKLTGKEREPARWVIFLGQHHNGALRQVIIRDGQLAMTRMTPVGDAADPETWAADVYQEFRATVSYLSRFGFSPDDGVDVVVVCNPAAGSLLEKMIDVPCHYSAFTAPEAARELGITIGAQDDPQYADSLHAAWIGQKTRFALPMQAAELSKVHQPRQIAAAAMLLLLVGAAYLIWQIASQANTVSQTNEGIVDKERQLKQATADYEDNAAKMKALGFDVKLVQGSIKTFKMLDAKRIKDQEMVKKIDEALGDQLRVDSFSIDDGSGVSAGANGGSVAAPVAASTDPDAPVPPPVMNASIKLSFPSSIQPEFGVQQVNDLKHRLETLLPNFKVTIVKNVAGLEYSDTYQGEAASQPVKQPDQQPPQYVAEISLTGTMQ